MAKLKKAKAALRAAQLWMEKCLLDEGSMFGEQQLWTQENFRTLDEHFRENLEARTGSFIDRLKVQLSEAPPAVKQLAAEVIWVLDVALSSIGPAAKLKRVNTVWRWSGAESLAEYPERGNLFVKGCASAGAPYNTLRQLEFQFAVSVLFAWAQLDREQKNSLLRDGWQFATWLDGHDETGTRQFRHVLLFILFPDLFENSFTGGHKIGMVVGFYKHWNETVPIDYQNPVSTDRQVLAVRTRLEEERSTDEEVDFYAEPYWSMWHPKSEEDNEETAVPTDAVVENEEYSTQYALRDLFILQTQFTQILNSIRRRKNLILQGPPGVGKTFIAKRIAWRLIGREDVTRVAMVQFHQSYAYEDFVQGYRPTEAGGFILRNGQFFTSCKRAEQDPATPFVFIIDEINRGNLSRIFGELLMLIEGDKRGDENAIRLIYAPDGTPFSVPANLYILGMMNTADRSLAMVDYALRRRFAFVTLKPAFDTEAFRNYLLEAGVDQALVQRIDEKMIALNKEISQDVNLGPGYTIGHSYFVPTENDATLDEAWYREIIHTQIEPLLREYWFDQSGRADEMLARLLA